MDFLVEWHPAKFASPNTSILLSNWVHGYLQVIRGYLIVYRATLLRAVKSVDESRSFLCQPRRTDANLDIRHVLLPNDHPIRPRWVPMEASWPSHLDLELNRPPLGVAIRHLAVSFLALLEPWVVLPTVMGSGRSHHDSDHHSLFLHQLGRPPTALLPSSTLWMHVVYSDCFALVHTTQIPAETVVA